MKEYITGLTEGQGYFFISFLLRTRLKLGIEVRPSFSISLNKRDLELIKLVRIFFNCGSVRFCSSDRCYKYETRSLWDIDKNIIKHFDKYPLLGSKQKDFLIFKNIILLMKNNGHKNKIILINIIEQAYNMNPLGKRKYSKDQLLSIIYENNV